MLNFQLDCQDFRLLLPEVIFLEPEHFEKAKEISIQVNGEARQWQTYLNTLVLFAFKQWLSERIPEQPFEENLKGIDTVCECVLNRFKICLIATENLLDEVVNIPRAAIENPDLLAHFYVVLEVSEEEEQVIYRGFLRYDRLIDYRNKVNLPIRDDCYELPLIEFDSEPNHLLLYSQYADPASFSLPVTSEELPKAIQKPKVKLSKWLEGNFDLGWQDSSSLLSSETNLAFSLRSVSFNPKACKLINLGMQLEDRTLALLVTLAPETTERICILVQLLPTSREQYLPCDLELILLSKAGKILQKVQSRSEDNCIQLKLFKINRGKSFSIQINWKNVILKEDFEV